MKPDQTTHDHEYYQRIEEITQNVFRFNKDKTKIKKKQNHIAPLQHKIVKKNTKKINFPNVSIYAPHFLMSLQNKSRMNTTPFII